PVAGRAGVPAEIQLAVERGVPSFLIGGLGGVAKNFVRDHPEILHRLRNGLDEVDNRRIAEEPDYASLAQRISSQLARMPVVRGRVSDGTSFRILALDGGGLKGTFTAAALATCERHFNARIAE